MLTIEVQTRSFSNQTMDMEEIVFDFSQEILTVAELIERIVIEYAQRGDAPMISQTELNTSLISEDADVLDLQIQIQRAIQAFEKSRYLILVDNHRVKALSEILLLMPQTHVTFLRLTPLVGG